MKYQICLVKNRTKESVKIQKYLDWFKLYTPLEIEVNVIETDFDVTPQIIGNDTYKKGVICSEDIIPKLRTVIPENKYNAVVLYVGNSLNDIRLSVCNGKDGQFPLYPDTELIQLRRIDDNGKDLNHELFHAFFYKARKCQINIQDPMDTYIKDDTMLVDNILDTNREIALQLLKPYWDKICAFRLSTNCQPIITITRKKFSRNETIGELRSSDGQFGCDTLELPWLHNLKNMSCIPTGTYICKWNRTLKFPLGGYEVQNVPNRSGIRLHPGNYFFDIQGCILLGSLPKDINKDGELDLQNSRLITSAFEKFMNKKDFTLIIK